MGYFPIILGALVLWAIVNVWREKRVMQAELKRRNLVRCEASNVFVSPGPGCRVIDACACERDGDTYLMTITSRGWLYLFHHVKVVEMWSGEPTLNQLRELITHEEFGRLRLKTFAPPDAEVEDFDSQEWMNGCWISETVKLDGRWRTETHLYRHEDTPEETGGLAVDFADVPERVGMAILEAIHLPLRRGMTAPQVCEVLGKPKQVGLLRSLTFEFILGSEHPYYVSVEVNETTGLRLIEVLRNDLLTRIEAEL